MQSRGLRNFQFGKTSELSVAGISRQKYEFQLKFRRDRSKKLTALTLLKNRNWIVLASVRKQNGALKRIPFIRFHHSRPSTALLSEIFFAPAQTTRFPRVDSVAFEKKIPFYRPTNASFEFSFPPNMPLSFPTSKVRIRLVQKILNRIQVFIDFLLLLEWTFYGTQFHLFLFILKNVINITSLLC